MCTQQGTTLMPSGSWRTRGLLKCNETEPLTAHGLICAHVDLLTTRCYPGIVMPHGQTLPLASMARIEHVLLPCICRTENMTEEHMWTALDSSGNGNHLPLVTPPQPAPVTIRQVF